VKIDRDDFCSAALRHLSDAEALLDSSPDQAWHLAGFGPECARKASLDLRWLDKVLGHDLGAFGDDVVAFAAALDPAAARYQLIGQRQGNPMLGRWSPNDRYARTGTRLRSEAASLVEEAASVVAPLIARLWADGVVKEIH